MNKVLVLSGFGFNCEQETKYAFEKAKARQVEITHFSTIINNPDLLNECGIIVFPGGFSFGDNLGAGFALASLIRLKFLDKIKNLIEKGVIFLGICNGCQVLVKLGLFDYEDKKISITHNENGVGYKCMWRDCETTNSWHFNDLSGSLRLPVAHGEGRFVDLSKNSNDPEKKSLLQDNMVNRNCKIILKYAKDQNHNGSDYDIAGISNGKENVVALMPHLERVICYDESYFNVNKNLSIAQNSSGILENNNVESSYVSIYTKFFSNFVVRAGC